MKTHKLFVLVPVEIEVNEKNEIVDTFMPHPEDIDHIRNFPLMCGDEYEELVDRAQEALEYYEDQEIDDEDDDEYDESGKYIGGEH